MDPTQARAAGKRKKDGKNARARKKARLAQVMSKYLTLSVLLIEECCVGSGNDTSHPFRDFSSESKLTTIGWLRLEYRI
jgi:hypothetical protein